MDGWTQTWLLWCFVQNPAQDTQDGQLRYFRIDFLGILWNPWFNCSWHFNISMCECLWGHASHLMAYHPRLNCWYQNFNLIFTHWILPDSLLCHFDSYTSNPQPFCVTDQYHASQFFCRPGVVVAMVGVGHAHKKSQ